MPRRSKARLPILALGRSLAFIAVALVGEATSARAGPNASTSMVLHAVPGLGLTCQIDDPCAQAGGANVEIQATGIHVVYVMLRNYDNVDALQCAFQWPPAWTFAFGLWDCQPSGWICEQFPSAPGPLLGSYICGFDCLTGGATAVIGLMVFLNPQEGCLEVIESAYPNGTHVLACDFDAADPIDPRNRGRVCVGPGGYSSCTSAMPVDSRTWGSIKSSYGRRSGNE